MPALAPALRPLPLESLVSAGVPSMVGVLELSPEGTPAEVVVAVVVGSVVVELLDADDVVDVTGNVLLPTATI